MIKTDGRVMTVSVRAGRVGLVVALTSATWLMACGPKMAPTAAATAPANARIYTCDDASTLAVEYANNEARATFQNKTVTLPQVQSASGAHFEKDGVSVWNSGRDVTFAQGGKTRHCFESNTDDRAH